MTHNYVPITELKPKVMKKLNHMTNRERSTYMRKNRNEQLLKCYSNKAENWFNEKLTKIKKSTGLKWKRQALWGYRIFDFWNTYLGCAIEIDGNTHNATYDHYRDEYNFRRSQLVIVRVRNFNEQDATEALDFVLKLNTWVERKAIFRNGKSKQYWIDGGKVKKIKNQILITF